jgi:hypothetical protein
MNALGSSNPAGPFRRLNFVPSRDTGALSNADVDLLVPLNSEVCQAAAVLHQDSGPGCEQVSHLRLFPQMPSMLPVPPQQAAAAGLTAPMSRVADGLAEPGRSYCAESAIQLAWGSPRKAVSPGGPQC